MNLAKTLSISADKYSDKPAVIFEGRSYSFAEVDDLVRKHALFLRGMGVREGDRIAVQLPKCMDFVFLHLATLSLGAVTLPLNPGYTQDEIGYFLSDSKSSLFFTDAARFERFEKKLGEIEGLKTILLDDFGPGGLGPLRSSIGEAGPGDPRNYPTDADSVAMICYTSGTTGKPKGAMITHQNLVSNMTALKKAWQWTERDLLLHVLPLFHVHGLVVALHGALNAGSTVIMHESFDPVRTWETIAKSKCTMLMGVPTIYHRLMNQWDEVKPDLCSMRVFISGSAPLLENLFLRFESATGFRILERYGMTEAQMITSNPFEAGRRIPKSVGYPLDGVQIKLVSFSGEDVKPGEIGEVCIRGENIFKGYWNMAQKTEEAFHNGWFLSGDMGCLDPADGMRLYLVGRAKELIITGGFNVYPKEVENVLEGNEKVLEAAVVGLSDEDFGERVTGFVVLKDKDPAAAEELMAFCKKHLAGYKCPKAVICIDQLPRNAMGKLQKHLLKKQFEASP